MPPEESSRPLGSNPAIILSSKSVTLSNGTAISIPVNSVVVYTDYDNIQLRFACGEYQDNNAKQLYTYYFILVRSRSFNNLPILVKALDLLNGIKHDETIVWLHNEPSCKN